MRAYAFLPAALAALATRAARRRIPSGATSPAGS